MKTLEDVYFDTDKKRDDIDINTKCIDIDNLSSDNDAKCDDAKCDDAKCDDAKCDDVYTTCDIVFKNTAMDDSWCVKYGIESVKIYHGHVSLQDYSHDTSSEDDF
jgi:hypothetical protein